MANTDSQRATGRSSSSRSRSKPKSISTTDITAWLLRIFSILTIFALPWYFGCATWQGQYWLYVSSFALCGLIVLHCIATLLRQEGNLKVPALSWFFFALAGMAYLQSAQVFSWDSQSTLVPSIQVQRWALGLTTPPKSIESRMLVKYPSSSNATEKLACDLAQVEESDRWLAWSVEPLHTRAALFGLALCGLYYWVGRMVFSSSDKQLWLFVAITLVGIAMACFGIQGAMSSKAENFLGIKTGNSFASFVSKNSAGAYYNICIAGCLGLLGWTLLNTQRKISDIRYRFADSSWLMKIKGACEDLLADLNTPQIASMLCLVTIIAALLISLCRGAAASAMAALIAATVLANAKSRSRGGWVVTVSIVVATAACLMAFNLDERSYERIESLSKFDVEADYRQGRLYIWSVALRAAQYYGLLGSGLGTFHFAYLPFQEPSARGWFYHAESLYLQCGVDMGIIGILGALLALGLVFAKIQREVHKDNWKTAFPAKLAGAYLIFSQGLHSFVDFALILPALFITSTLLLGSVIGSLDLAQILPQKKRSGSREGESKEPSPRKHEAQRIYGIIGLVVAIGSCSALWSSLNAVKSLCKSDSVSAMLKVEDAKPIQQLIDKRLDWVSNEYPDLVSGDDKNPEILRHFAEARVFDFRQEEFEKMDRKDDWKNAWNQTAPIGYHMIINRLPSELGDIEAKKLAPSLNAAAFLFARAQSKSPLDWRLITERLIHNFECGGQDMANLAGACSQLGRHSSESLLTCSEVYHNFLDASMISQLRKQAMLSNPAVVQTVASYIAIDQEDGQIDISIFPPRPDTLRELTKLFTREKFPRTFLSLWERIQELTESSKDSFERQVWLAECADAVGDEDKKIQHLESALSKNSLDLKVICRLSNSYLNAGKNELAKKHATKAKSIDPQNPEVLQLIERFSKFGEPL